MRLSEVFRILAHPDNNDLHVLLGFPEDEGILAQWYPNITECRRRTHGLYDRKIVTLTFSSHYDTISIVLGG